MGNVPATDKARDHSARTSAFGKFSETEWKQLAERASRDVGTAIPLTPRSKLI